MNVFIWLYNTIVYQPIINLLLWVYNVLPIKDFGLALIGATFVIKGILLPLELKSLKAQKALKKVQKRLDEVQKQYKDNKEEQAKAMMEVYQQEGVNPFASIGLVFVQLPFLLAVFQAINYFGAVFKGKEFDLTILYKFITYPAGLNYKFLNVLDLSQPSIVVAVLVAGLQMFLMFVTNEDSKAKTPEEAMQRNMSYFLAGFMLIILLQMPSALGLYFGVSLSLTIIQQKLLNKKYGNNNQ